MTTTNTAGAVPHLLPGEKLTVWPRESADTADGDLKIDRMEERARADAALDEIGAIIDERNAALAPVDAEIAAAEKKLAEMRARRKRHAAAFEDRIEAVHDRLLAHGVVIAVDDVGNALVCAVTGLVVLDDDEVLVSDDEVVLRAAILPPRDDDAGGLPANGEAA